MPQESDAGIGRGKRSWTLSGEGRAIEHSAPRRLLTRHACTCRALANVNVLYLCFNVLILLDNSFVSRFWCLFEAWLSMQEVKDGVGCEAAAPEDRRCTIAPVHNATPFLQSALEDMWSKRKPEEVYLTLHKPDIEVTNGSDKTTQLKKVLELGYVDPEERRRVTAKVLAKCKDQPEHLAPESDGVAASLSCALVRRAAASAWRRVMPRFGRRSASVSTTAEVTFSKVTESAVHPFTVEKE